MRRAAPNAVVYSVTCRNKYPSIWRHQQLLQVSKVIFFVRIIFMAYLWLFTHLFCSSFSLIIIPMSYLPLPDTSVVNHHFPAVFFLGRISVNFHHTITRHIRRSQVLFYKIFIESETFCTFVPQFGCDPARSHDKSIQPVIFSVDPDRKPIDNGFRGSICSIWNWRLTSIVMLVLEKRNNDSKVCVYLRKCPSCGAHGRKYGILGRFIQQMSCSLVYCYTTIDVWFHVGL